MPRKKKSRVYWRDQGGVKRAYGDFRDLGGKLQALKLPGETRATTDPDIAAKLAAEIVAELEARKRGQVLVRVGMQEDATLIRYAARHLRAKRESGAVTEQWLEVTKIHLHVAISYFCNGGRPLEMVDGKPSFRGCTDRHLSSISVEDVQSYVEWLKRKDNGRGGLLSPSTQRKHLNSLSNLYRRAQSEGRVQVGYNPVSALIDKPTDVSGRKESNWLEVHDAALLLEAARLYEAPEHTRAMPRGQMHAMLAFLLLTGARPIEMYTATVDAVSFDRRRVRLYTAKTGGSPRYVPLWPQLEEILWAYLTDRFGSVQKMKASEYELLFPSPRYEGHITDIRKPLDQIAVSAGWKKGEVRPYAFRHTYCSARLQTLDGGAPVSLFTVARELGHGGLTLANKVYGHLGEIRHRSEVVEYRVENHRDVLKGRLGVA